MTTLTKQQQAKLAGCRHRITLYELVIEHQDGRRYLLRYTRHVCRSALDAIRHHGKTIVKLTGAETMDSEKWQQGILVGDWVVRFTDRTYRQAIIEGELPFIGDV